MRLRSVLVANRGEIAIRIMRAAADLGLRSVAVYGEDDARSLHVSRADKAVPLRGRGAAAYLDVEQLIAAARESGCEAVHPGYGFLSESAAFAQRCAETGLRFVGPQPSTLALLGDKTAARRLAERLGVPVLLGSGERVTLAQAQAFFAALGSSGAMLIKAVAGGGGRGMRAVHAVEELESAFDRCRSEAFAAFGDDGVYVERLLPRARHLEVQVVGDGQGRVTHLWERECSVQRRHQKLIELAPSPALPPALREQLLSYALRMAQDLRYESLGTFEFLIDADAREPTEPWFIEANPRLQVEHTVTEEITGVDLVQAQLGIASGRSLEQLGLAAPPRVRGVALQARVNMETMRPDGSAKPEGGVLRAFELPSGPGVRVDAYGYAGYATNPSFDSLLAKVIAFAPSGDMVDAVRRAQRALRELRIEGVATNASFLRALLGRSELPHGRAHTRFVDEHAAALLAEAAELEREQAPSTPPAAPDEALAPERARAGARIDSRDPLAVLAHGKSQAPAARSASLSQAELGAGMRAVRAPMQGTIVSVAVEPGARVKRGQELLVMEAMKMEHVIGAEHAGNVRAVHAQQGEPVYEGHLLLVIEEAAAGDEEEQATAELDLAAVRADLAEAQERHAYGLDARRPDAVERRRKLGKRTARENVADLVDEGTFVEYGALVIAAQRRRRPLQELIEKTPADGLIAGIGRVNGALVPEERAQCIVVSYDYTVLAGTQGQQNHRKKDRMFELAEQLRVPVVLLAEGGGGRPGDSDSAGVSGLDCLAFSYFAKLSGLVPLVGVASGRCFAGNALLLGCCDVVIATADANIGMGGPAMIEGGGLGVFRPDEIGPIDVQRASGVVDLAVADEREAMVAAKRYLSYFQGSFASWQAGDARRLRHLVPENRMRAYDVRAVIAALADEGSVLELRRDFGLGMVTALARVEGRPLGVIANNPMHLAGAIDRDAADKAARFMQLCDAHDLPMLFLCDTPGIMVGPEAEKSGQVRHAARMFVTAQSVSVPFFTIVLRKSYGLGAQAMAGGSFKTALFVVSWPTGEFGGMGLEGAVKLGFRKELEAIEDPAQRKDVFDKMVAAAYQHGKAVNVASHFEIDDVIDPADSRQWILSVLRASPRPKPREGKKRPFVDSW